jgi:hypothetical protein
MKNKKLGYNTYIHVSATRKLPVYYLKQAKMSFFSFTKLENRRAEQVLSGRLIPLGEGRTQGKGLGR